jgi:hypothetical protein
MASASQERHPARLFGSHPAGSTFPLPLQRSGFSGKIVVRQYPFFHEATISATVTFSLESMRRPNVVDFQQE